jgi:tartrate dehydratase beta subunit/fumarate hydratase class I family protein
LELKVFRPKPVSNKPGRISKKPYVNTRAELRISEYEFLEAAPTGSTTAQAMDKEKQKLLAGIGVTVMTLGRQLTRVSKDVKGTKAVGSAFLSNRNAL